MSPPPRLPDLKTLSGDQKDQLIRTLYDTLLAMEGERAATPGGHGTERGAAVRRDELQDRITTSAPSRRGQSTSSMQTGAWTRLLNARPLQIVLVLLGLGFAADLTIGRYQHWLLERQRQAALALRSAALDGLYVELIRVALDTDGRTYRATLHMQNSRPDAPLYIMMSPPRVFVQTGTLWRETSSQEASDSSGRINKLSDGEDFFVLFQTDVKDWTELIPGYMHVRIDNQMLISRSSRPKDDIVERNNVFYVYLKPRDADDEAIKRRSRFPGKPPLFIPMPPH